MMRGRAYRHDVKQKSNNHRLKIVTAYGYKSIAGYLDGQYIKFSINSKNQRHHKKISNKKIRYSAVHSKGNGYRKYYEYKYRVY